ncbi:MAG: hypothetical protein IPM97_14465 [Bdellovibrionaceae bacterium]|nr:hypothetical protein [Pseudobdellovibrionaceae bacterium]
MSVRSGFFITAITTFFCFSALAAESKSKSTTTSDKGDLVSSFRCEKFSGSGLGDLKLKMIETCDLDRPFSSSLSRSVGGEDIYMFCCHKSK